MTIADSISQVDRFKGSSLRDTIADLEFDLHRADVTQITRTNSAHGINQELLLAMAAVKRASAQIDVAIHTAAILYALPHLLREDEVVESMSLGAGSAGSDFDVVTSQRLAEFKFIFWQGGTEAGRKKTLFQDYYKLVRRETDKEKYIYLLNIRIPLNFLRGNRTISTVLNSDRRLLDDFLERYGNTYRTVGEFYRAHESEVQLVDLRQAVPGFNAFVRELEQG